MLKTFTKGEKKLFKGLKMEYFQFTMVIVKMKKMKKMKKINKKDKKKNMKKNQKKASFSNILRINQKVLAIFFLIIILILINLVIWQKNYLK